MLPTELWYAVLHYVDGLTLRTLSQVSKQFHILSKDQKLWKVCCYRKGYKPYIEDMEKGVDWKRVFVVNFNRDNKHAWFDYLTTRVSDLTLWNVSQTLMVEYESQSLVFEQDVLRLDTSIFRDIQIPIQLHSVPLIQSLPLSLLHVPEQTPTPIISEL